ncbi:hypothetical protein LCGC14_1462440 [marine sediment metagenome]|uniref:Uncharacterized protein n=1 Tax=marine sediment metagenome TaxID=412755 RepID=A0A0F9JER1_9ZZZZ
MGVRPATFQSGGLATQHYLPGAYSRIDFIKGSGGLVSINNGVVVGDARGGKPNELLWFGSATAAAETLRAGKLLDAIKHAFSPGGGFVPQKIATWRVNPGTQSSHDYKKGANTMIEGKSKDYGLHTNQIKTKLEAGSSSGKKLTIKFMSNDDEIWDDVEKESFEIQYTGAGSASTMNITKTQLDTTCTGAGSDDLVMLFSVFDTIEDIVNYINDQATYTCTLKTSVPLDPSTELDSVSAEDIKTSAYTALSDLQALIDAMNESAWAEANYYAAATTRDVPDDEASWVYFTAAIDGAYTSTEWGISLSLMEQEDVQFISSPSEDASVHALIKTHCKKMNGTTGKNERQFILGGAAGETVAQTATRAGNLTSDAGILKYPGFKHYDFNDLTKTKTWSPAYYAAKILGMIVSLSIQEPITNKSVDVLEWEKVLTITEAETLVKAGVSCGIMNRSGRKVNARGVTTFQGNLLQRNEFSMMRISLFASKDLRTAVEQSFIGKAMSNTLLGKVDAIVVGKLSQYSDMGLFNGNPPYWGFRKTVVGDIVEIDYDANLTPPTNFLFVTSHFHVFASVS